VTAQSTTVVRWYDEDGNSVREQIGRLIEAEDKKDQLSDEEIPRQLTEKGVDVSRRTVTKYRKAMEIPSSRQRRRY